MTTRRPYVRIDGDTRPLRKKLSATRTMLKGVAGAAAAFISFQGARAAIGVLSDFGRELSNVRAKTQATTGEMESLTRVIRESAKVTPHAASDVAAAAGYLAQAGLNIEQISKTIKPVLDLATNARIEVQEAADIGTNIMTPLGIAADDASAAFDVLALAVNSGNTNMIELGEAMSYAAPVAKALGLDIVSLSAIMATMAQGGIIASRAGTAIRQSLKGVAEPTEKAKARLDQLGVSFTDASGRVRKFTDILHDLEKAQANEADMMLIFGQRAGPSLAALLDRGIDSVKEIESAINRSGASAEMAAKMMDNLGGDTDTMKSAAEELMLSLGDAGLTATIRDLIKLITAFANRISVTVKHMQALKESAREWASSDRENLEHYYKSNEWKKRVEEAAKLGINLEAEKEVYEVPGMPGQPATLRMRHTGKETMTRMDYTTAEAAFGDDKRVTAGVQLRDAGTEFEAEQADKERQQRIKRYDDEAQDLRLALARKNGIEAEYHEKAARLYDELEEAQKIRDADERKRAVENIKLKQEIINIDLLDTMEREEEEALRRAERIDAEHESELEKIRNKNLALLTEEEQFRERMQILRDEIKEMEDEVLTEDRERELELARERYGLLEREHAAHNKRESDLIFQGFRDRAVKTKAGLNAMKIIEKAQELAQLKKDMKTIPPIVHAKILKVVPPPWGVPLAEAGRILTYASLASSMASLIKYASGGLVPGTGTGDSVPALLTPGEGVVPRKSFDDVVNDAAARKINALADDGDGDDMAQQRQPIEIHTTLELDGDVIAQSLQRTQAGD